MLSFIDLARTVISAVQKRNQENPDVKTADKTVFETMEKEVEDIDRNTNTSSDTSRAEAYKEMRRRMEKIQKSNEADPHVETADSSVFDEMQRQIEELNRKIEQQQQNQTSGQANTDGYQAKNESRAVTNSNGGSLEIRKTPSMGASKLDVRIPDGTLLQILEHSDQSIILDGQKSTFVFVNYNGHKGWILDSYLNMN